MLMSVTISAFFMGYKDIQLIFSLRHFISSTIIRQCVSRYISKSTYVVI